MRTRVSEHSRGSAREPEPLWPPRHAIVRPAFGNAITASRPLPRSHHPPPQYCACSLRLPARRRRPRSSSPGCSRPRPIPGIPVGNPNGASCALTAPLFAIHSLSTHTGVHTHVPNSTAARRLDPVAPTAAMGNSLSSTQVRRDVYTHRGSCRLTSI